MTVCVERDPDRGMAQMTRYLLDIDVLGDKQARASMPQIVRAYVTDPGAVGGSPEGFAGIVGTLRISPMLAVAHAREYEIEVVPILARDELGLGDLRPLLAQCFDDDRRQGDLGPRGSGFDLIKLAAFIEIVFDGLRPAAALTL